MPAHKDEVRYGMTRGNVGELKGTGRNVYSRPCLKHASEE
jgi:hypothetical protein